MRTAMVVIFFLTIGIGTSAADIVISEIMYNSIGEDVEFVELYNYSDLSQDLEGWLISDDLSHVSVMLEGILDPHGVLVVVQYMDMFTARYPGVTNINPNPFGAFWNLNNSGDEIFIFDDFGGTADYVKYDDGGDWPIICDGGGPSLELINPAYDNADPFSWIPSDEEGGTPGTVDFSPVATGSTTFSRIKTLY